MDPDALAEALAPDLDQGLQDKAAETFAALCLDEVHQDYTIPDTVAYLVHYTTLDALLSMLGISSDHAFPFRTPEPTGTSSGGFLRVYDTFYSNDPNEGYFFVNSVKQSNRFRRTYKAVWQLFEQRSELPAYSASLVCAKSLEKADDLVFWRTYGRDGTGCALAFPIASFAGTKTLFRVQYGPRAVKSRLTKLHDMFDGYSRVSGVHDIKSMASSRDINKTLSNALSPLVYLHKSKDYSYEKEARIVIPFSDIDRDAVYCQIPSTTNAPRGWRHFAELPELSIAKLLVSNSVIILGPTVDAPDNIKFVLQQRLDQFAPHGPKVTTSRIAYRS